MELKAGLGLTNATKGVIGGVVSAGLNLAILFGVPLSPEQTAGINGFVDAVLIAWIVLTYKDSPKRIEE